MLRATVIICGILLGLLLAAIGAALIHSNPLEGFNRLLANPWGLVTLVDLSISLLFIAAWLAVMEPRPLFAVAWIIALFLLGNVVTLVYLLCRTRYTQRFSDLFLPSSHQGDRTIS